MMTYNTQDFRIVKSFHILNYLEPEPLKVQEIFNYNLKGGIFV
jgi:hypothetical protein